MTGDDPRLAPLGVFTPEKLLCPGYGNSYIFFAGRDDIHGILHYLISRERLSFKCSMYGYDDDQLNADILNLAENPSVHVQVTLDKSQAGGVHERRLLESDIAYDPSFYNSFTIIESETHQIAHTKAGLLGGQGIGWDGSTNLSASGEGIGVDLDNPETRPKGFKAQENTLHVFTSPVDLLRLNARLDKEHTYGLAQNYKVKEPA